MGLITYSKLDRDFDGGIYLSPLGKVPPLDRIESVTSSPQPSGPSDWRPIPPAEIIGNETQKLAVLHAIERAGLLVPDTREPLAELLQKLQRQNIRVVVANATPIEPSLNTPLAILHCMGEQVFAGLAILINWLGADRAVMAYPHHFAIDREIADKWRVCPLPVSDKYPQARPASILRTLRKQGHLSRFVSRTSRPHLPPVQARRLRYPERSAVVFDMQLLRQVERLILANSLPTERIVTVSGDGVARPSHFIAPVGLPLKQLLERASIYDDAQCVIDGSSLAGVAVDPDKTVIGFVSQSFTVVRYLSRPAAQPCIRCGWCIDDCPAGLNPIRLLRLCEKGKSELAVRNGLHKCVECGICSYICPSHLPIMNAIRMMKRKEL